MSISIRTLKIFVFFFFIYSSLALSLFGQKEYNPQNYLDSLNKTQFQFDSKVAQIKQQIENVRQILDNSTITNQVKVIEASQGMADERNTLYDMQQILKIPFQLRQCKCAQLDDQKRQYVNQKISNISNVIANMRQSLKKCNEERCPRYQEIALELSQSQNYLKIMNETINSECCRGNFKFLPENPSGLVNIAGAIYKDNLNAKNWYYGSTNQKQYILKRFELATKFNLTSCPITKPYVNLLQNKCGNCVKQNQYFNIGDRKCYSCPHDQSYFNVTTGECHPCLSNQYFDYKSRNCLNCPPLQGYNVTTKKCQTCARNQFPSQTSLGCQKCQPEQYYNPITSKCEYCDIAHGYFLNKNTIQCDKCPDVTYYNLTKGACVNCSNGAHFNATTGKCEYCPQNYYYFASQNICKTCPSGQFFNSATQKCFSCPSGTYYNQTTKICTKQEVNVNTTHPPTIPKCPADKPIYNSYTKTCDVCKYGYTLDVESNTCKLNNFVSICPPDRPIYNSSSLTCMACPAQSQYDPVNHICKGIFCGKNQYLDSDTLQCVAFSSTCTGDQQYDPKSQKCIDLSTKCNNAIQTYSDSLKKCVPFNEACPKGYYFNTLSKRCISVTSLCSTNQYYSYSSGQCMPLSTRCTDDQYYNQSSSRCQPKSSVCTSQQYYNNTLHECRLAAQLCANNQIYNQQTTKCILISSTCNVDQFYSKDSNKCLQKSSLCTADQIYIRDQHKCIDKSLYCSNSQFYSTSSHTCVQGNSICYIDQYFDKQTNSCKTISSLCLQNGTAYDQETNKCIVNCPSGFSLNKSTNRCQKTTTTSTTTSTTTTIKQCKPDQTYQADVNICVKTFTTCTQAQFYNYASFKCQAPTYITSPYSPNLLMQSRMFSQYQTYYNNKVDQYSGMASSLRDCPVDHPYYDTLAQGCISCPTASNIFNLQTSKCSKCGSDYVYNPSQHKCIAKTVHHRHSLSFQQTN